MKTLLTSLTIFLYCSATAQDSSGTLMISGYAEIYYSYDFNKPGDNNKPAFLYSHNRHNEFALNLGFIRANYTASRVRGNLALAAGTYMNANYTAEMGVFKNVYEANAGVKISKHKELWLDAGILPSHIGFESAVSKDCRTLTRSLLAENSPYYEAGARLTYTTDNAKWIFSGLLLNGWQRIQRVSGNSKLSWGTQVQYKPSEKLLINYSTFVGTDKPDSARLNRIFHNFYAVWSITGKAGITAGFDIGAEQKAKGSRQQNSWFSPVLIASYMLSDRWAIAARAEYYSDVNGVIIYTGTPNGFKTTGYSINTDYCPFKNTLIRFEVRSLQSSDAVFIKSGTGATKNNVFLTGSFSLSF